MLTRQSLPGSAPCFFGVKRLGRCRCSRNGQGKKEVLEDGLESGRAEKSHVRGKWCAEGMWPGREWWERPVPPDVQKFEGGMK